MYMRFVHLKITEDNFWEVRKFYEDKVIPTLQATEGCLFASLLQPTIEMKECVSMTIWASQEYAEAYEASGVYDRLLDESDEAMAGATEWRAELTGDRISTPPPIYDPKVEGFPVEVGGGTAALEGDASRHLYLRIVAVRIDPSRFQELRQRYDKELVPSLLETPGCRAAFLVEGIKARTRALSVTVWDSEEDAVRYELSGRFDELVSKISEFFSGLYQWKLSLSSSDSNRISGDELEVSGYNIVTGRRL
ncbi:MAG: antibiotic biosynthesis monooxygenase [Acidobacteriota bacterium]